MKTISFLTLLLLFPLIHSKTQSLSGFNYQAVIRDLNGLPFANQQINIKFSIIPDNPINTPAYSELHTTQTNQQGMVSLVIGQGSAIAGDFDEIKWENENFFVRVSSDFKSNGNYQDISTTQLLSVPYALYAREAGNSQISELGNPISNASKGDLLFYDGSKWDILPSGNDGDVLTLKDGIPVWKQGNHFVGEFYGGGIIFFIWEDSGVQHGLIAALTDIPSTAPDSDNDGAADGFMIAPNYGTDSAPEYDQIPNAKNHWLGMQNTENIASYQNAKGLSGMGAQVCRSLTDGGYNDWYIPSVHELSLLYRSLFIVNKKLDTDNNPNSKIVIGNYWASTLFNTYQGWAWHMARGYASNLSFNQYRFIRPIRQF